MSSVPQVNYTEIFTILGISIISAILFDLPLQEISKIITRQTENDTEIKSSEEESPDGDSPKEDTENVLDAHENNVDREIDEIWNNDDRHSRVSFAEEEDYAKRSFTPVWKKSDDEKPVWGDDEEECEDDAE